MPGKLTYEYAVIRFVPLVEREEFINVGVIVFSKRKNFLQMKFNIEPSRIKALAGENIFPDLAAYLQTWEKVCQGGQDGGPIGLLDTPFRFRWLTASRSTIIQSSKVHPGLCEDPQEVLEKLFQKYVL